MPHRPRRTREFNVILRHATGALRLISKVGRVQRAGWSEGPRLNVGHSVVYITFSSAGEASTLRCSHHTRPGQLQFTIVLTAASGCPGNAVLLCALPV